MLVKNMSPQPADCADQQPVGQQNTDPNTGAGNQPENGGNHSNTDSNRGEPVCTASGSELAYNITIEQENSNDYTSSDNVKFYSDSGHEFSVEKGKDVVSDQTESVTVLVENSEDNDHYIAEKVVVHETESEVELQENEAAKSDLESNTLKKMTEGINLHFVTNPDFGNQEYYDWLTTFTECCKLVQMPLETALFQKISQVHKTVSDVMASPSGVVAEKGNFVVLMTITKELSNIINEHLMFIMQNLCDQ